MAAAKPRPYQTAAFQFGASTVQQLGHLEAVLTDAVSLAATTGAFSSCTFEDTYGAYARGEEPPALQEEEVGMRWEEAPRRG